MGAAFMLLFASGPIIGFHISGLDVKPSVTATKDSISNEIDVTPWIMALTASVVSQFAMSAIFVTLFSTVITVRFMEFKSPWKPDVTHEVEAEDKKIEDAKWGYRIGLLLTIPGFMTLTITMIIIGLTGSLVR
jgi:hypothetical protein